MSVQLFWGAWKKVDVMISRMQSGSGRGSICWPACQAWAPRCSTRAAWIRVTSMPKSRAEEG